MATLAKLVVKLITDVSEFEAGMKASAKKMTKIGEDFTKAGKGLTAGVTLPIVAAGGASVKFAADLADSTDAINTAFGDSSGVVAEWAKGAATNLGLSQASAEKAASGFGFFLTNMGVTGDKAAGMSKDLVGLATDLGELKGVAPEEMMAALQSALAGRGGEMKKFGVIIDEARIKAKAMEMGIYNGSGAMDDATKATAAYRLIMDQTTKYQGFFAGQTGDVGVELAKAKAKAENLAAAFGERLIPVLISLMEKLIPILDYFNNLSPATKDTIINILGIAAAVGPVLVGIGQLITAFTAISGLFAAGGAFAGIATFFTATLPAALSGIGTVIGGVVATIGLPVIALVAAIGLLVYVIINYGQQAWGTLKMIGGIIWALLQQIWTGLTNIASGVVKSVVDVLSGVWKGINDTMKSAWTIVKNWASNFYTAGQNMIIGLINGIASYATTLYQQVAGIVQWVIDTVNRILNSHSPSKVFEGIGINMMLGMAQGVDAGSAAPAEAVTAAVGATTAGSKMVSGSARAAGGGNWNVTIYGDLSDSARISLRKEVKEIIQSQMEAVIGGV